MNKINKGQLQTKNEQWTNQQKSTNNIKTMIIRHKQKLMTRSTNINNTLKQNRQTN